MTSVAPGAAASEDAYTILGVSPDAEHVVIRAAYRALMHKYSSPARIDNDPHGDDIRARAVQTAYERLSDPDRRAAYDAERRAAYDAERQAPRPAPATFAAVDPPLVMTPRPTAAAASRRVAPQRRRSPVPLLLLAALLVAGVVIAGIALMGRFGSHAQPSDDAASGTALEVRTGKAPAAAAVTSAKALPCFVGGQLVGDLPLSACAARNGVATGPMNVGVSQPPPQADPRVANPAPASAADAGASPDQGYATPRPTRAPAPPRPRPFNLQPFAPAPAPPPAAQDAYDSGRDASAVIRSERSRPVSVNRTMAVVRAFYEALGEADGRRAASLVTPEKRAGGPLSAPAIRRFYGSLSDPLQLTSIRPLDPATAEVHYRFVTQHGEICSGAARVSTTDRDGQVLIRGIRTEGRC